MELYENLGFSENPFSTFSAEEEKSFLNQIYINPLFYETLRADLEKGHSRFILGARGIGKTALILQLKTELERNQVFTFIVDHFDGLPVKNNAIEFTRLIIEETIINYCFEILNNPICLKKLDKHEKEKLSFIIKEFFKTLSRTEYEKLYNKANPYKKRNFFRNLWNYFFNRPVNFALSSGIEVLSELVRNSMGLPTIDQKDFYKNYLPEIKLEEINKEEHPEKFLNNIKSLKEILSDLTKIIQKTGYKTTVIFIDKIDEYTKLNGNITSIAEFLESFLKDTTLLMNNSYSLVFSLWNILKPELTSKGIRFDKIKPIDITWQSDNLKEILNKRIKYFSQSKKIINNIVLSNDDIDRIIELSSNSPRYLLRQLSYIYDQQADMDMMSKELSHIAIEKGQLVFAENFEYYAIYPTKRGTKEDILTNINRLLKIGKNTIMTKDFVDIYKVSTPTAISYIKIVLGYNLIKELPETENGAKKYKVTDPVINFLINHQVFELKN